VLKRLIEVALPLKEVSAASSREKAIRHGHISTLHIWWARRPLATCRAAVFAALLPDPDDAECPDSFRTLVSGLLGRPEFKPQPQNGKPVEDTPRNRCLEFMKHLVTWENSNRSEYIEPARKLISAAHKLLNPDAGTESPKVLDPFAGGGAIPLEALRLGCDAHAVDLNPVAHLIQLCTLVYPQKFGQRGSRPLPDHIRELISANAGGHGADGTGLFAGREKAPASDRVKASFLPSVEITEEEYLQNPLATDIRYWGHWVLQRAKESLRQYYPTERNSVPVAYIWARTIRCTNPSCALTIPLIKQLWLCNKANKKVSVRLRVPAKGSDCRFDIVADNDIDFDPEEGTAQEGEAACPRCQTVIGGAEMRSRSMQGQVSQQLVAVVTATPGTSGKAYRAPNKRDLEAFEAATEALQNLPPDWPQVPTEPIPPDRPSPNSRGLSGIVNYGLTTFGAMFNSRQLLTHLTLVHYVQKAIASIGRSDLDYATAVGTFLGLCVDQVLPFSTSLNRWKSDAEAVVDLWGRQAVPMVWDYCENNPIGEHGGTWEFRLERLLQPVRGICCMNGVGTAIRGTATRLPEGDGSVAAVITDPPYYDSVPYSDLSDFFYVWLKRSLHDVHPELFRTPLTPKREELIAYYGSGKRQVQKSPEWYEGGMANAFSEMRRALSHNGISCVMFAHKTTSAWESIIAGLLKSGLMVTASWPFHTELTTRMVARDAAALASSVTLVCRPRPLEVQPGLWDDVRRELQQLARERLDFFWSQGIRGADFFISAIGPALSVFGQYERVTKLSGEEVTVGQFLDEVRSLVTNYALSKIMNTSHTGAIDSECRFYVVWKWSYGEGKVPADESFKLAQALGMDTEIMWDRTGVLEKGGENVQAVSIEKRMKVKELGEKNADGSPASLIDVLHRLCAFREKGDNSGMAEFLTRSGQGQNSSLWLVAQAVSEILPDGDKEKQLMQGLLNQRDTLQDAARSLFG
jgi:putative DNA methylase